MLRRALGISTAEPCFGFITVIGLILPAANYVAFFMLNPHEFARAFPGVVLTLGFISVAVYSYFMNVPLSSAYDEKRFLRARVYSNWAIIADILGIILTTIGIAIILSHPTGFSAVGVTLAVLGNTMFYVSYVPLVAGRYALFKQEDDPHAPSTDGASSAPPRDFAPVRSERAPLV